MSANQWRSLEELRPVLQAAQTIAVIGVSANAQKPAHYVPEYMQAHGYRVLPVNASMLGEVMFGEPVRAGLLEVAQPVDIVNVFRRAEHLQGHLPEILTCKPKLVWVQLGIWDDEFAQILLEAGIDVVQNRCIMADHRNLRLPAKPQV